MAPWQWPVLVVGALLVGISKTGLPGLGVLVAPALAVTLADPLASNGLLLPLLSVADCFAVAWYRRHAQAKRLWELSPWIALGMVAATPVLWLEKLEGSWPWLAGRSGYLINVMVGLIVASMVALQWWRGRHPDRPVPSGRAHTAGYGVTAGFATTIANAAGPVSNLYLLSQRLPKEEFIATGAWLFLVINLVKVPIYVHRGMITPASLALDACLVPAVVAGTFLGLWLFRVVSPRSFERWVFILALVAALLLFVPKQWWRPAPAPAATAASAR